MSTIKISNLSAVGSELFQDSETFLNELTDQETEMLRGSGRGRQVTGVTSVVSTAITIVSQVSISVGISINSVSVVSI